MQNLAELLNSKKTVFIGRSPENDIVLDDAQTSPIHCQVSKIKKGVYMVVDLESETGTFVNDKRISKGIAGEYDTIKVGNHVFQLDEAQEQSQSKPQEEPTGNQQTNQPKSEPTWEQSFTGTRTENTSDQRPGKNSHKKEKIIVYFLAAPEDEPTCEAVHKHLSTIRFSSSLPIEMVGEFKMTGGEDIASYRQKVNDANIYLAFVSVDFLNNNSCYELLKTAIDNHNQRKAILLPILVRNCMWKTTPFASLPLLPKNQQPLNNKQFWNSEDDALTSVADDIYHSISELTKDSTPEAPLAVTSTTTLKTNWRGGYLWKNFWKRTAAYLLDIGIIMIPMMVVLYLVFGDDFFTEAKDRAMYYAVINTSLLVLIYSFFDSSGWRGTPGKAIMKLQITDDAGNPISFSKAFLRNIFKFFLFGFLSSLDETGVITLVMIIVQIACYVTTRKFIHDYLTHTVIGERLKKAAVPVTAVKTEGSPANTVIATKASRSMAPTIAGIVGLLCVVLFLVLKFVEKDRFKNDEYGNNNSTGTSETHLPVAAINPKSDLTEATKSELISAVKYSDETEIEAMRKLDISVLSRAFMGDQLVTATTAVNDLIAARTYYDATLERQEFHQFALSDDGMKAEVRLTETWSGTLYSADNNSCVGKIPSHSITQTIYFEQTNSAWMVYNIVYDNLVQPQPVPCDDSRN